MASGLPVVGALADSERAAIGAGGFCMFTKPGAMHLGE